MDERDLAARLESFEARMQERRTREADEQPRKASAGPPIIIGRWSPQRYIDGRRIGF